MTEATSLEQIEKAIGQKAFCRALSGALPGVSRGDEGPSVDNVMEGVLLFSFDLNREEEAYAEEECRKALASPDFAEAVSGWSGVARSELAVEDGIAYLGLKASELFEDQSPLWMDAVLEEYAEEALERLAPDLAAVGCSLATDAAAVARELRRDYSIQADFGAFDLVERMEVPATVLLAGSDENDADLHASRHVLTAAHNFITAQSDGCSIEDGVFRVEEDFIAPDGTFTIPEHYRGSAAEELCASQGVTLEDVVNGRSAGRFADSLRSEISEGSAALDGWPAVCVLATLPIRDAVALALCSRGYCQRDDAPSPRLDLWALPGDDRPLVGIYDAVNGCGGCLSIELERPMEIRAENVCRCIARCKGGKETAGVWTVDDCYGLLGSCFSARLARAEEARGIAAPAESPADFARRAAVSAARSNGEASERPAVRL